jgi:uncharacterized membrane protein
MTQPSGNRQLAVRLNFIALWVTRHWLRVALIIIGVYASLPWVAPTLMQLGATGPANILYTLYSPFCHQFAFRSFFLFGERSTYPRADAGIAQEPYEEYIKNLPEFDPDRVIPPFGKVGNPYDFSAAYQIASREFVGNAQMGYKTTLCERDVAIYSAIFIGGLGFARMRRRLRPIPIWLYVLLGIAPIAIDGLSQLLSLPPFNLWPPRETLPIFRVVTGITFGLANVWLGFPYLEMSMRESRDQILAKLARAGIYP